MRPECANQNVLNVFNYPFSSICVKTTNKCMFGRVSPNLQKMLINITRQYQGHVDCRREPHFSFVFICQPQFLYLSSKLFFHEIPRFRVNKNKIKMKLWREKYATSIILLRNIYTEYIYIYSIIVHLTKAIKSSLKIEIQINHARNTGLFSIGNILLENHVHFFCEVNHV